MHFSRRLKSSRHCLPSPDGNFVATLFPSLIHVRSVQSLDVVHAIKLPQDLAGPVFAFQWSPTSRFLLVAASEQIDVFSALDDSFHAAIRNAFRPSTKPVFVCFGASDEEVCVLSALGLRLTLYSLPSSKAVEIANPKLSTPGTARNGFSFRPQTRHLALLTRISSKDMVSIHEPGTRQLQRSWFPDTIDGQGLLWSPDGKWLITWESAAQGHKILFYTPDGHVFKTWTGFPDPTPDGRERAAAAGVRTLQFSPDANLLAVADQSKCACVLDMRAVTGSLRLQHPNSIEPGGTLQVWQEQTTVSQTGISIHTFIRSTQTIFPPARSPKEGMSGCSNLLFDSSSNLLATRLEESPTTLWIWDVQDAELRAVLLFHTGVTSMSWHPTLHEILLVRCEGDQYRDIAFIWDPLSEGPRTIKAPEKAVSDKDGIGTSRFDWLNLDGELEPILLYSDHREFRLVALLDSGESGTLPWRRLEHTGWDGVSRDESPLELLPLDPDLTAGNEGEDEEASELDDTFHYKKDAGA